MIYMDNAATTQVYPEAAQAAYEQMTRSFGNPGSLHDFGLTAEHALQAARQSVAEAAGVFPEEIFFAPGATAANNAALRGAVRSLRKGRIISTAFEHPSVEETLKDLERTFEVVRLLPKQGVIDPDDFRQALTPDTVLVTCMQVNNETGAVTPLKEISDILKKSGVKAPLHTDAVQGFLKEDFPYHRAVDMATFAGHKTHAPKGIGALYLRKGLRLSPVFTGGGQENGLFSGTENVPAAVAWGIACRRMKREFSETRKNVTEINHRLRKGLEVLGAVILSPETASPYVLSAAFPGYLGENILHYLSQRDIYVSTGSACSSKKPSRVLTAIGAGEWSRFAIRFSFCGENTPEEAEIVLSALHDALQELSAVK